MAGPCDGDAPPGITYATTAQNWSQTIARGLQNLTGCPTGIGCPTQTVTLAANFVGIDVTTGLYQVYINDSNAEVVTVSGGTYNPSTGGTITFISVFSHGASALYTIGSASSGIQEALNAACGISITTWHNQQCNVTVPANGGPTTGFNHPLNTYNVYGTIFFHSNQSVFAGYGSSLNCLGRGPCLQVGDLVRSTDYVANAISGFSFRAPLGVSSNRSFAGLQIVNTVVTDGVATIITSSPHGFRPRDLVTIEFTDDARYWGDAIVSTVPSATTFTYAHTKYRGSITSQVTPGVVALAYEAILDNGGQTHFTDIQVDSSYNGGTGLFNDFFDLWDDENATIDHFNNNGISLNRSANWVGCFVCSFGASNIPAGQQLASVISLRDSSITANGSNGVTDYNSNGLYIENTIIQASGPWQVYSANSTGNYQGAYIKNIYSESNTSLNPRSPASSPFPGLGIAGLIAGQSTGAAYFEITGSGQTQGTFATGGAGSKPYSYFIVANDTTAGTQTSPMQVLNWFSTGSDSIPVRWPRVANGTDDITYDVIRMITPVGVGAVYPHVGGCLGGPGGTCGYVAQGLTQSSACSGGLVCAYTDSGAASTSPYASNPTTHPLQGNYSGNLIFWPGSIVSVNKSVSVDVEHGNVVGVGLGGNPIQVSNQCSAYGTASSGGYTACLASTTTPNNSVKNQTATLITDGPASGGGMSLTKGRLNFSSSPFSSIAPHHIITLIDSQPAVTRSTMGYRPTASENDTWIGTDVSRDGVGLSAGQLAFGAPVSITNYIHATGDGFHPNWLERLTLKQKTFAVPVRISEGNTFTLGAGSPLSQMKLYTINNMPGTHVPPQNCVDVVGEAKGLTKRDQISSITPPGKLGNLSLNAYPADDDAIVLHFCNPSGSEVITPAGAYSFLAVH
ncbi:MAG: hypothetical protein ACLP0H_22335 [Terriglobales bacterium]